MILLNFWKQKIYFTITHSCRKQTTEKHFRDKAKVQKCMCTHEVLYIIIISIKYITHLDGIPRLLHNQLFFPEHWNTKTPLQGQLLHMILYYCKSNRLLIVSDTAIHSYLFIQERLCGYSTLSHSLLPQLNLFLLTPKFQEHP